MTLEFALALAREIHAAPGFELVAVGRFLPLEQLAGATDWMVSVLPRDSPTGKPVMIREPEGWLKLGGRTKEEPRRDEKHRQQLSLF